MEKQSFSSRLCGALQTFMRYGCQHAASLAAVDKNYTRSTGESTGSDRYRVDLQIRRCGQLYEVSRRYFVNDQFRVTDQWLATYGWHGNGHLIALGRTTYVIFDPVRRLVVVEDFPENGPDTVDVYYEAAEAV